MMTVVEVDESERSQVAKVIETGLLAALVRSNTQAENDSFVLVYKGQSGSVAGGVTGGTSYGWLLIKTLWVDEMHRGAGLGKQLVLAAEGRGREIGCHSAWLDTSSEAAHSFYSHLGYSDFGVLANEADQPPTDHCRWFMKKTL
ncbi:MAG: GNAT family N-acetyltransferase [Alphaproteobacteria bacterium]|nr:GNAT family N-acetyltransferase [Alphaproteobacteria bacterium]